MLSQLLAGLVNSIPRQTEPLGSGKRSRVNCLRWLTALACSLQLGTRRLHMNFNFSFKGFCFQIGRRSSQSRGRASPTKEGNKSKHPRRFRTDSRRCRAAHTADPCSLSSAVRCPQPAHTARPAAPRWGHGPRSCCVTQAGAGLPRALGSPAQEGHAPAGAGPEEGHKDALKAGEEKAAERPPSSLPVPKGGL